MRELLSVRLGLNGASAREKAVEALPKKGCGLVRRDGDPPKRPVVDEPTPDGYRIGTRIMPGPTPARPVASARGTPAAVRTVSSARTLRPRWQPTRLLDLPEDVLVTAFALWPAESLACASVTCRELHAILDVAVALGVARLGYDALPPARGKHDTRTHRLRHLQRLAARRPQTLSAGATTSLCLVGSSMVLAWGGSDHEDSV